MSIEDAKKNIGKECYIVDLEYTYARTLEDNKRRRSTCFLFGSIAFIALGLIANIISFNLRTLLLIMTTCIIAYIIYQLSYAYNKSVNEREWVEIKCAIVNKYVRIIDGYEEMEPELVQDMINQELAPMAGLILNNE